MAEAGGMVGILAAYYTKGSDYFSLERMGDEYMEVIKKL